MREETNNNKGLFSAKDFVSNLLIDGGATPCDDSVPYGFYNEILPTFYDEEKYQRGQQFYQKHIFAMFFGKLLGLMTMFTCPTTKTLLSTNKSSIAPTAYKRYMRTILHMHAWYSGDFKPGSKAFASINQVKQVHNSVSNACPSYGLSRINQLDMASTQFGFMGYIVIRTAQVGIFNVPQEELEGFVHFWKVIGHALGIEERYNICRDSLRETQEICEELVRRIYLPGLRNMSEDFIQLSTALLQGMDVVNPVLQPDVFRALILEITPIEMEENTCRKSLSYRHWITFWLVTLIMPLLRFSLVRQLFGAIQNFALWCSIHFPFAAHLKYGPEHCNVLPSCLK